MSPEMLMQPFDQSFNVTQQGFYGHQLVNMETANDNNYFLGYTHPHHPYPYQQQQQLQQLQQQQHHQQHLQQQQQHHQHHQHHQHQHQQQQMDGNGDFRPAFYNPFEIKHRRRTSRAQLKVLEKSFLENPKPNATVRRILAQKLDMTPRGVQIWFQNRRAKAKLLRRKSGQEGAGGGNEEEEEEDQDQPQKESNPQDTSPVLFTQFFNNLKTWDDNNARSLATAAAASCIFDHDNRNDLVNGQQHMMSFPIHPLAPVIDQSHYSSSSDELGFMNLEDWRRKSCPALGSMTEEQQPFFQMDPITIANTNVNRRMTTFDDKHHFVQPFPIMKPSNSECSTPRWNSTSSSSSSNSPPSMDFYTMNYSPLPQQLTPMLSTGSPVPSIDGGYYDSCLDLLMNCSPSNDK